MSSVDQNFEQRQVKQYVQKMLDERFCSEIFKTTMEVDENNYLEKVAKKIWDMGWNEVHEELEEAPYCEKQGQITKIFTCPKCNTCKLTGLCVACYENGNEYHPLLDREKVDELEEKFVKIWGKQNFSQEISEKYQKAYIDSKQKEREGFGWGKEDKYISRLPFCENMKKTVRMITCIEYEDCPYEGCCFTCFKRDGNLHKVTLNPLINSNQVNMDYLKICSWDGYNFKTKKLHPLFAAGETAKKNF